MNIFFLSWSPQEAARLHCDKHVVKMIIETAQMLYSAHWTLNPENLPETAYKLAHKNHPCSIWVRTSLSNYMWLASLGIWLCKEYQYRYGEHKQHKTQQHLEWLIQNPPKSIPFFDMTSPAQAMPDEYKQNDSILAYQTFYRESKLKARNIVRYTKREWPEFLIKE
jgi:hypothetical protein